MRETLHTIERGPFTGRIFYDDDSGLSWDDLMGDRLGTLVVWHRRYTFDENGEKRFGTPTDFLREARRENWFWIPVAMIDHSGISLYEGTGAHACDPGGWDSGQVGFYYTTRERLAELGVTPRRARAALRGELREIDKVVRGEVYGYAIEVGGEVIDSCWGFIGEDYIREELTRTLDWHAEQEAKAERCVRESFAL